jgi:hypothetical protein
MTIAETFANVKMSPGQPGLFDRRADFAQAALQAARADTLASHAERLNLFRESGELVASSPLLRLVLEP